MSLDLGTIGLSAIRKITDLWAAGKSDSLIAYTQVARVEPVVLVDADCLYLESIGQVQQSLLSMVTGYYLQAIAISSTVGKIEVFRHLDRLNPSRNPMNSAADSAGWLLAQEAYTHRLPVPGDTGRLALEQLALEANHRNNNQNTEARDALASAKFDFDVNNVYYEREERKKDSASREAERQERAADAKRNYDLNVDKFGQEKAYRLAQQELQKHGLRLQEQKRDDTLATSSQGFGRDTMGTLRELADLSVGKIFNVELTDGLHSATIPISIRLMASSMPSASLVHILSLGSEDNSVKERYHGWRSGRLSFWKDLVACVDIIDAHRKNLMADKDGVYSNLVKRTRSNQLATLFSGNPSVASSSNIVVISNTTAEELERKINGQLKDFKTREAIFKKTYLMIMAVIDKQWERVTFYYRGINGATEVGVRDLKAANKGSGPDVSDILRAYSLGNSPTL